MGNFRFEAPPVDQNASMGAVVSSFSKKEVVC
jgi:hypothetical protein